MNSLYYIDNFNNINYITTLILSLFINKNIIYDSFLENDNISINIYYIQELIKHIIYNLKKYNIVNYESVNYLRMVFFFHKFNNFTNYNNNIEIIDLYNFIYDLFCIQKIELIDLNNTSIIHMKNYLDIDLTNNFESNQSIKLLLKKIYSFKVLNNIPNFICFNLIRNYNNPPVLINIQKKISINSNYNLIDISNNIPNFDSKNKLIWTIHSIICFDSNYFSFIYNNNEWIYINDNNIGNHIKKINIKNYENIIKEKSILIIYKFFK